MRVATRVVAQTLLSLLLGAACLSCTSARLQSTAHTETPVILASNGPLSSEAAAALLSRRVDEAGSEARILAMIDAFRASAQTPLVDGNRVSLLVDGPQTIGAIRRAIEAAVHHVHLETYIFADDEVGREIRDLLIRRRAEGIEVRVLYDGIGSLTTGRAFFDEMSQAGIDVLQFRPIDPVRTPLAWRINNRDHRKIVIVDGQTAFTGGINFSSTYASSSRARPGPEQGHEEAWRDTHVQIDGPVAAQFQSLFMRTWTRAGGRIDERSAKYFPDVPPQGKDLVAAVASEGGASSQSAIYSTFHACIEHASQRIWMTQAYFAPNDELLKALVQAAQRGVDVRLIVPGFTDSALIFHAARASYDELLAGGVRIYEQNHALLHAKTLTADGALSAVGSANFDMRSFIHNNEVNAFIVGSDFAARLEQLFERDLKNTHEITLETWRERSALDKLKEFGSSLFRYWL